MQDKELFNNEVKTLNEYVAAIRKIRMHYLYGIDSSKEQLSDEEYYTTLKEPLSKKLFFRGQKNKDWFVMPNVFRDNGLSCESAMINKAYLCEPDILIKHRSPFERLTFLQHYELGTRLLDITANPFVALFFACEQCTLHEKMTKEDDPIRELINIGFTEKQTEILLEHFIENNINVQRRKDGVVYFKCAQAENFNKKEIQILAHLAEVEMKQYSIEDFTESLVKNAIITISEKEKLSDNNYKELINILESTYCVESNFSNQRLIRQDGSFLITGHINTKIKADNNKILLEKATGSLLTEFEQERIIIPEEYKENILRELDHYNINERSLFPEIDHQLKYIQMKCRETSRPVALFEKQPKEFIEREEALASAEKLLVDIDYMADVRQEYVDAVKSLFTIDWEKSDNAKANIKIKLKKYLVKDMTQSKEEAELNSESIFNAIYKKYNGKTYNHSTGVIE